MRTRNKESRRARVLEESSSGEDSEAEGSEMEGREMKGSELEGSDIEESGDESSSNESSDAGSNADSATEVDTDTEPVNKKKRQANFGTSDEDESDDTGDESDGIINLYTPLFTKHVYIAWIIPVTCLIYNTAAAD